ncbi:M3 family metallopeptidase [bacterium]|nr:M3 family metallopeptidase [bacterium]
MRNIIFCLTLLAAVVLACTIGRNPLLEKWETPYGVPPFEKIRDSHFVPAFKTAMAQHQDEIAAIVSAPEAPTFKNTIEALDYSGQLLQRIQLVFFNLNSANTSDKIQKIAQEVSPLFSKHGDDIALNSALFQRVRAVYEQKDTLDLTVEQAKLLAETYKGFVRGGANLPEEQQAEFRKINEELSMLTLKFGENVLAETNGYQLMITDEADLAGLPQWLRDAAAEEAGEPGKWAFTLQKPSWIPFLQYAENRDLRESLYRAVMACGNNDNAADNKKNVTKIVSLRNLRAKMLGYPTHSHFMLADRMAQNPENVYELLEKLWDAALPIAKKEVQEMQRLIDREGGDFKLESWDWWHYAEKVRQEKYAFSEEDLKPYFELNNVKNGLFEVAQKLYGLQLVPRDDIPKYNPDVEVFEVKEADGTFIGLLYMDFFVRSSKRGGAWMTAFRTQMKKDGEMVYPIISTVFNFPKPTADAPVLLSFDNVTTMYHEFGHALHGLFSKCTYPSLSGTNVSQDFVELPSQIMENWGQEPAVMKMFAKHYQTGEAIPQELLTKLENSGHFNQGFATVEYLAASILDMDYHTVTTAEPVDPAVFEAESMKRIGLIPEMIPRYRSTYFRHVFSGGYSSGYYSYIWAEVLDADAFNAFKETDLFDQKSAQAFRKNILEKGGTEDPMELYLRFRGKKPGIGPLLKRRGLK